MIPRVAVAGLLATGACLRRCTDECWRAGAPVTPRTILAEVGAYLAQERRATHDLHETVPTGRSTEGWRAHVKATHYKLQLHSSNAFLITPSLSASMYLLALRLYKRQYELAARLIPSVLSDVPFVGEESWVKGLFDGITDDPNPNAVALRLRIALQVIRLIAFSFSRSSFINQFFKIF